MRVIPSSLYPCPCYFKRPRDKLRLSSVEIPKSEKGSTNDSIRFIKETLLSLSLQSVFFTDIPLPRGEGASWRRAVPINELRTLEFFVCWWERIGEILAIIGLIMVKMVRLNQKRLQLCNEIKAFLKSLLYY